jgi:hypothetical protein
MNVTVKNGALILLDSRIRCMVAQQQCRAMDALVGEMKDFMISPYAKLSPTDSSALRISGPVPPLYIPRESYMVNERARPLRALGSTCAREETHSIGQ